MGEMTRPGSTWLPVAVFGAATEPSEGGVSSIRQRHRRRRLHPTSKALRTQSLLHGDG